MTKLNPSYRYWSVTSLLVLLVIILVLTFNFGAPNPLSWDTIGYHAYFVELITDGDLQVDNLNHYEQIASQYENTNTLYQFVPVEDGFITKYSMGWAILNSPFLFIGHLFAGFLGYPQDGFSLPYQFATYISSLFYTLLGLYFCRKLFLQFFSDRLTAILLIILVLGTNYLHMNYACIGLVHIYLFPLYAILLYSTYKFHKEKSIVHALVIGITIGLMTLTRPTEIIAVLIPLLYGITSVKELGGRLKDFFTTPHYFVALIPLVILVSFQLFYWKYTTNTWIFYSYQNPGEGLDLDQPHIIELLLSFRKGWFIYTPVMVFLVFGLFYAFKKHKAWFWPLIIFTVLNIYIISSWTSWWYAGSFSSRALEHSYPVYILLIGFFLIAIKGWYKKVVLGVIGLLITLNLFQTWQVQNGILHLYRMSKPYYVSIFGQTSPPTKTQEQLLLIDRGLITFENKEEYDLIQTYSYQNIPDTLSVQNPYTPPILIAYNELTDKDHLWFRASCQLHHLTSDSLDSNQDIAFHLCANALHNGEVYAWRNAQLDSLCTKKCRLNLDYLTPNMRYPSDTISVGLWLQSGPPIVVKKLDLEVYAHQ